MNQQVLLGLTPVSGCNLDDAGNIQAGVGVIRFLLNGQSQSETPRWRHAKLKLQFHLLDASPDIRLRATILWQDVSILSVELNNFNEINVHLPVYDFKTPSVITIKILKERNKNKTSEFLPDAEPKIVISSACAEPVPDLLGARRYFANAASVLAAEFGLTEDHLDIDRAKSLESRIINALNRSLGFSAIRLGDGEGRVLAYPDHFSDQEVLEQVLHYHFGPESMKVARDRYADAWISKSMEIIKQLLIDSVKQADVIGLPVVEYFTDDFPDKIGQAAYACALFYGTSLSVGLDSKSYFGTNVFQYAAMNRHIFRSVVTSARRAFLVGPWDLREALGKSFGRNDFEHIEVPGHYSWRGHKGFGQYPDLFRNVEDEIIRQGDLSQSLFLVGAGLFGKYYCNLIKSRNGVALDIGSVFDSWARKGRPEAANDKRIDVNQI